MVVIGYRLSVAKVCLAASQVVLFAHRIVPLVAAKPSIVMLGPLLLIPSHSAPFSAAPMHRLALCVRLTIWCTQSTHKPSYLLRSAF